MNLQPQPGKDSRYPPTESVMSVVCIGRRGLLDDLHERQRFEAAVSREGFRHEEFTLQVHPANEPRLDDAGRPRYEVKVTHTPTRTVKGYRGGGGEDWVIRFAEDLAAGLYGQPEDSFAADPGPGGRSA
jgi:hypothetical protein